MTTTTTSTTAPTSSRGRLVITPHRDARLIALCVVGAGLTVASGAIHLQLWNELYRHITVGHMNTLFLLQWIACFVGAAALLVMRNLLAVVANAALLAGTFTGFLIAKYHSGGLFGFGIPGLNTWQAQWTTVVEIVGTLVLLTTAVLMVRQSQRRS